MLLNRDRAEERMERYGLDALIFTSTPNVIYASDFEPGRAMILPRRDRGKPVLLTSRESLQWLVTHPTWISDIRAFGPFSIATPDQGRLPRSIPKDAQIGLEDRQLAELWNSTPYRNELHEALSDAMVDLDLAGGKIGLDESGITYTDADILRERFPGAVFLPGARAIGEIRMVKTAEELVRIRHASRMNELSAMSSTNLVVEGVVPSYIRESFYLNVIRKGGHPKWFILRSGSSYVSDPARTVMRGDAWYFDSASSFKGYFGDTGRSGYVGDPSKKQVQYYHAIRNGIREALNLLKPGVKASSIAQAAMRAARKAGCPNYGKEIVGHSLGVEVHELPLITTAEFFPGVSDYSLEPGMVLCIEMPFSEIGFAGVHLEKTVHLTSDGFEYLTSEDDGLLSS